MDPLTHRIAVIRNRIELARKVSATCEDKGTAANLRLYIAELEMEMSQLQAQIAATQPPNKPTTQKGEEA